MKIVELGNDRTHDVDGEKFGVMLKETDLHSSKELSSIKCMNRILTGKSELKAEDKTLKTLFIEYKEDTFGNGTFKPSGLSTTEAGTWRINIRRLVIELDTNFLRFCYDNIDFFNFRHSTSTKRGPKCTGFLIPVCDILDLHNMWEDFDAGDDFHMSYARYFDADMFRKLNYNKNKKP